MKSDLVNVLDALEKEDYDAVKTIISDLMAQEPQGDYTGGLVPVEGSSPVWEDRWLRREIICELLRVPQIAHRTSDDVLIDAEKFFQYVVNGAPSANS